MISAWKSEKLGYFEDLQEDRFSFLSLSLSKSYMNEMEFLFAENKLKFSVENVQEKKMWQKKKRNRTSNILRKYEWFKILV